MREDDPRWTVSAEHVRQAILNANESSPGPDDIPCRAWQNVIVLATDVLHNVVVAIKDPTVVIPDGLLIQFYAACLRNLVARTMRLASTLVHRTLALYHS